MKKLLLTPLFWLMLLPLCWAQGKSNAVPGENIQFPVAGGGDGKAYLVKPKTESGLYLFLFHDGWGLNDNMIKKADELAKSMPGVNVMAIDMLDGNTSTEKETADQYMADLTPERVKAIITAAYAYAGKGSYVASMGWGPGANWAMQTALAGGKKAIGCVMYYGTPETDEKKLKTLKTDVMAIFAKKDASVDAATIKDFQTKMTKVGNVATVKTFDADHGFANVGHSNYNATLALAADKAAVGYLKKKFAANK